MNKQELSHIEAIEEACVHLLTYVKQLELIVTAYRNKVPNDKLYTLDEMRDYALAFHESRKYLDEIRS